MLRTNTKKAKQNLMQYLRNNSEYIKECAAFDGETIETDADILSYIWRDFIRVKGHELSRRRYITQQDAFMDYASGLPLGVFDYFYNVSAVELVGDILEETEAERSKYSESDAEWLLTYMIYREASKTA